MPKKYKITEKQYRQLMAEGVSIQGETNASGKADMGKTSQAMSNSGIDPRKVNVEFSGTSIAGGSNPDTVTEHRRVTKKELMENRRRYLKEHSELLPFTKFLQNLH